MYGAYELGRNYEEGRYTIGNCKKDYQIWFDKKWNYMPNSTTIGRHIAATSGWTNLVWMKNMGKTYIVPKEVPTPNCDKLEEIGIRTSGVDITGYKSLKPPLG